MRILVKYIYTPVSKTKVEASWVYKQNKVLFLLRIKCKYDIWEIVFKNNSLIPCIINQICLMYMW